MTVKVIDASVAASILFVEAQADLALGLISGAKLIAPSLLPFELGHVAVKKMRRAPDARLILEGLGKFKQLGIELKAVDILSVTELAFEKSLSGYDAAYL